MRFDNVDDLMHRTSRTDGKPKEINQLRNTLAARALDRQLLGTMTRNRHEECPDCES
jgi:hypothetical protein